MNISQADAILTINLDAIVGNYQTLASVGGKAECGAVVKANAYGLGVEKVAIILANAGAKSFFVATLDEGIELRKILPNVRIFIFHGVRSGQEKLLFTNSLIPILNDTHQVKLWQKYAQKTEQILDAIIHIDTGMSRLGFNISDAEKIAYDPAKTEGINILYIMSHFACASEVDSPKNNEQYQLLTGVIKKFPNVPVTLCNSAGILLNPRYHFDLLRPGIAIYGSNRMFEHSDVAMQSVVDLKAKILQLRVIDTSQTVGYGATRTLESGAKIATLPVGYADGYIRSLGNVAAGYIDGHKAPVVGRVSMDMIMVDVTNVPEEKLFVGAEVELLGSNCTIDDLAEQAGTISYEVITGLGSRFGRVYTGELHADGEV